MRHKTLPTLALIAAFISGCTTSTSTVNSERKHYTEWEKNVGYTQLVRVDNTLYLAGLGGMGKTQEEQLNNAYQNIKEILADYRATTSDIVKEVIYTTNIDELITLQPARKKHFSNGIYPASTWVQIDRLYSSEMKIEIDVTVQLPPNK